MGIGPEKLVGICMNRSIELIVRILAILKAGGAYVPLDPDFPKERISYMIEDSGCSVIITEDYLKSELKNKNVKLLLIDTDWNEISKEKNIEPESNLSSDNLAYLIYTSGSTGKPKGVMVQHRNVVNFFTGMDNILSTTHLGYG